MLFHEDTVLCWFLRLFVFFFIFLLSPLLFITTFAFIWFLSGELVVARCGFNFPSSSNKIYLHDRKGTASGTLVKKWSYALAGKGLETTSIISVLLPLKWILHFLTFCVLICILQLRVWDPWVCLCDFMPRPPICPPPLFLFLPLTTTCALQQWLSHFHSNIKDFSFKNSSSRRRSSQKSLPLTAAAAGALSRWKRKNWWLLQLEFLLMQGMVSWMIKG